MNEKKSSPRTPEARVDPLFPGRWSPRSFKPDPLDKAQILGLLEAARWAPSCFNEQPWLFIYAAKKNDLRRFVSLLTEKNRRWAKNAPLLLFIATRRRFSQNGRENPWAEFDAGSAWMSLALCARKLGLYAHAMAGFDRERSYEILRVPKEIYKVVAAIAVGKRDSASKLPEDLRLSEKPNGRRPLPHMFCEGSFKEKT